MRKVQFANQYFYHIYNRGVDKRKTFMDDADFRRFYAGMYLFNNALYRSPTGRNTTKLSFVQSAVQSLALDEPREQLVNIVCYCIMPNHYHFLLEQLQDRGITQFMHRLDTGYTKYFNKRYERTGRLFEGSFKAVLIRRDAQFEHLPRYIHLNALDLTDMNWREGKVEDWKKAEDFLERYPWSSHQVYLGKAQLFPVVEKSVIGKIFQSNEQYMRFLRQWSVREMGMTKALSQLIVQS